MKQLQLIIAGMSFMAAFSSCHNPDQKWDSKSSADTLNSMKDSVADSSRSVTRDLVMSVDKDDAKFAVAAAAGGLAEVQLGELAKQKASSEAVKDFGAMMVSDHSKANDELKALCKNKGITLPATLDQGEQKIRDDLSGRSGKNFDRAYTNDMIEDHQNDIKEFESAITMLKDRDLKAFAQKTLPTLKMHLQAIQKIHKNNK